MALGGPAVLTGGRAAAPLLLCLVLSVVRVGPAARFAS